MTGRKSLFLLVSIVVIILIIISLFYLVEFLYPKFSYRSSYSNNSYSSKSAPFKFEAFAKINTVRFASTTVSISLVSTPGELEQGLSGRESLGEFEGMLFVFETPDFYEFWMKDMKFPIDIMWIHEDGESIRVVDIAEDVKPESFPVLLKPKEESLYVLEVNAGFARAHNIHIGDSVIFAIN